MSTTAASSKKTQRCLHPSNKKSQTDSFKSICRNHTLRKRSPSFSRTGTRTRSRRYRARTFESSWLFKRKPCLEAFQKFYTQKNEDIPFEEVHSHINETVGTLLCRVIFVTTFESGRDEGSSLALVKNTKLVFLF